MNPYVRGASVEVRVRIIDAEGCAECVSPRSAAESAAQRKDVFGALGYAPDALPIVGELADHPGCFFIGAHSGHGMGWAFVAAQRLAALVLHGTRPGLLDARRLPGHEGG